MLTKILRYAVGRDDKIVSAYEDVTFGNEYMDWYVDTLHDRGNWVWNVLTVVELAFVACF